jgi:ankyrin repeat protein
MLFTLPEEHILWHLRRKRTAHVFSLLDAHPRLARHRYTHGLTLLHMSAIFSQGDVVERLVGLGADPAALDDSGHSALHLMAYESRTGDAGYGAVVELLVRHGADVNAKLPSGETALDIALSQSSPGAGELVDALKRNGARCSIANPSS